MNLLNIKIKGKFVIMLEEKICGIYKITSPSGRVYIGQGSDVQIRKYKYSILSCKSQIRLYNSIIKHGWETHTFEIIEECEFEMLNIRERHWQDFYDVLGKKGLNCVLTETDELPKKFSEETKKKMADARKGGKLTEEHKRKIGRKGKDNAMFGRVGELSPNFGKRGELAYWFGKTQTEESNRKRSESLKTTYIDKAHHMLGKTLSEEIRKKMGASRTGGLHNQAKKVINTETGKIYSTIKEAAKDVGVCYSKAIYCLKGEGKGIIPPIKYYTEWIATEK